LWPFTSTTPPRRRAEHDVVADDPLRGTVDPLDARHAVLVLGRRAAGPEVVPFGHVRVGVDDLDLIEREVHAQSPSWRPVSVRLFIAREAEVDAAVARVEPATRDDLRTGEEVHAVGAVRVAVAEQ
jgi:hypothetical protein